MTDLATTDTACARRWTSTREFGDFVRLCGCGQPHLRLMTDPESFAMNQRGGRMGAVTICDMAVGADMSLDCGEACGAYRVFLVRSGRAQWTHRGSSVAGGAGTTTVYAPGGLAALRWQANAHISLLKIDRSAVEDVITDALGHAAQPEFRPVLSTDTAPARNWLTMLRLFTEQFFAPDGLLSQPLVGMPFVDSLVRGFLMATEHSHLAALIDERRAVAPRAIRSAIEIIEAEAHLPLTLSSIAARSQVSSRSLQQGFKRHLGTSPMSYLRDVRLRRAHQALLESDPSTVTVASVAYDWGFTNLGRFAAAHAARYREAPAATLRRSA